MSYSLMASGVFTSDGSAKIIDLPGSADYMEVENRTQAATTQTPGRGVKFRWYPDMADDTGLMETKAAGTNVLELEALASGGFKYVLSRPAPEAAVTGTVITTANPAVCTATSHGYAVGDRVRIYGNAAMKQIAGMEFEITAVADANTFTLGYLDASGFAAAETAFSVRRIAKYGAVLPEAHYVTNVSQAASAVVTFSSAHNYKLGDVLYFRVSSDFAMVQLDKLEGKVTAVSTANNTVTVDIDSSAFTAFAFPLASVSPNIRYPLAAPAGKRGLFDEIFDFANRVEYPLNPFRNGQKYPYMELAAGVDSPAGSTSDVIEWKAWKSENN